MKTDKPYKQNNMKTLTSLLLIMLGMLCAQQEAQALPNCITNVQISGGYGITVQVGNMEGTAIHPWTDPNCYGATCSGYEGIALYNTGSGACTNGYDGVYILATQACGTEGGGISITWQCNTTEECYCSQSCNIMISMARNEVSKTFKIVHPPNTQNSCALTICEVSGAAHCVPPLPEPER